MNILFILFQGGATNLKYWNRSESECEAEPSIHCLDGDAVPR